MSVWSHCFASTVSSVSSLLFLSRPITFHPLYYSTKIAYTKVAPFYVHFFIQSLAQLQFSPEGKRRARFLITILPQQLHLPRNVPRGIIAPLSEKWEVVNNPANRSTMIRLARNSISWVVFTFRQMRLFSRSTNFREGDESRRTNVFPTLHKVTFANDFRNRV